MDEFVIQSDALLRKDKSKPLKATLTDKDLPDIESVLASVPDPEVPALTLQELGIIRHIELIDGNIHVTLTPTYMGCPATVAIRQMISDALTEAGYPEPTLHEQLTPAWTTDWISDVAKEKLRQYGIAPPNPDTTNKPKACPQCGSKNTELVSQFGATACKAMYRCLDCREPFEYFKCH